MSPRSFLAPVAGIAILADNGHCPRVGFWRAIIAAGRLNNLQELRCDATMKPMPAETEHEGCPPGRRRRVVRRQQRPPRRVAVAEIGANALVRGSNHSVALQPLSVQGQVGLTLLVVSVR